MSLGKLITLFAIFLLVFSGCGKKKKEVPATPKAEIQKAEDTADIFDEFYDDSESSEAVAEEPVNNYDEPQFNENGRYVVQVSCVLSEALAADIVKRLEAKGYPAYIAEVENPTTDLLGVYRRIRIGGFTGISDAKNFGENQLASDGYDYWVDNKSNDNVGIGGEGLGETQETSTYDSYESSEPATETDSYESTPAETNSEPVPATTNSYESTPAEATSEPEPATTDSYESTPAETSSDSEPSASYESTTEPEPATEATTEPSTTTDDSGGDWETSDDDWGSDTTSW